MASVTCKKLLFLSDRMFVSNTKVSLPVLLQFSRSYARGRTRRAARGTAKPKNKDTSKSPYPLSEAEILLKESVVGKPSDFDNPNHLWENNPYDKKLLPPKDRSQSRLSLRPKIDPQDTSIILFPGQGSQFVGMGRDLFKYPIVRDLFEAASETLGYNLKSLCLEGPKQKLDLTQYCQPAVMVTSLATVEKLKEENPQAIENCVATAGFSVGELSALVFAGALPFNHAMRLVKVRAEAMHLAAELAPSGMATVMYGPDSQLGFACKSAEEHCLSLGLENPYCGVANYLYPHCKVVAGNTQALEFLAKNAAKFKLRRVRPLPVSGAFHTELMRPAVEPFRRALRAAHVTEPIVPVHSNVDAHRYRDPEHIKRQLPKQIVKPVRWEQTMHALYERAQGSQFPKTFECGPGSSLKAILKMVNARAWETTYNIGA